MALERSVVGAHEAVEDAAFDGLALDGGPTFPGCDVFHDVDERLSEEALDVLDGVGVSAEVVGCVGGVLKGEEVGFSLVERKEVTAGFIECKRRFDAEAVAVKVCAGVEIENVEEVVGEVIAGEVAAGVLESGDDHHEEGVRAQAAFEGGV